MKSSSTRLIDAIANAAEKAFVKLFSEHDEMFYYCSLTTTGEAHAPVISAWSLEALEEAAADDPNPTEAREELKWSYSDSPYYAYGEEFFDDVNKLFSQRPALTAEISDDAWVAEFEIRLSAMEEAMKQLSQKGVFGIGFERDRRVVLVEIMPPDHTNTERAHRLNSPAALADWLEEAAE